ncbi:Bifunctional protein FolD protein [Thalassovita gelatinovora]|uniref:methenyltetrahydrofolate cyclohydrolase n=2 Tax=Thalassovita gelatinovora TaxID=53501 RepID=A0A0P1F715_THAGE|nr:Bifunctional protein FolD protein [Thalassovita gelatinovora]SER00842.1 methylenetetrahydrofolate dehydrogenase (NADP+) / methenyltetrahydrofolate cyclohydrolase [Thalassovita gelatinovora]
MAAYGRRQQSLAAEAGIKLTLVPYPATAAATLAQLKENSSNAEIDAVAALHPLPTGLDPLEAALTLGAAKDIDGQHPLNAGLLALGAPARPPATAMACRLIAEELAGSLTGREVTLVGASRIVGRPLAHLLLDAGATVTVTHVDTKDLVAHTRRAEIVVTAAGVPGLITPAHLAPGTVVLDVSINRGSEGLVGDLDLAACAGMDLTVTDVPDGVGPVTTALLFKNVADAAISAQK